MRILHTSDWHIGHTLYGKKRYDEFELFFEWLLEIIRDKKVNALLISGDIFDTTTPSNKAQSLYYRFLCDAAAATSCSQIIVTGGNHDSPSFLEAPKDLLNAVHVEVIGAASDPIESEVKVLKDADGQPCVIVCAVPYLRDRDIRNVAEGESLDDKQMQLFFGIKDHYRKVYDAALKKSKDLGDLPVIAMGHIFAAGGLTVEGDGVRNLYVGALSHMGLDVFPKGLSYTALGHLHVPQKIGGQDHIRYSGSPLPMGFNEAAQTKQVVLLTIDGAHQTIETLEVPQFQALKKISGDVDQIREAIKKLAEKKDSVWLEIEYNGQKIAGEIRHQIDAMVADTSLEVLRIKNQRLLDAVIQPEEPEELLEELDTDDVFKRVLELNDIEKNQQEELWQAYRQVIHRMHEKDQNAE